MFLLKVAAFLLLAGSSVLSADVLDYKGYKVYEVVPQNENQADALFQISQNSNKFDFWTLARAPNTTARVMVAPEHISSFEELLTEAGLTVHVVESDLSEKINTNLNPEPNSRATSYGGIDFNRYYRHDEINNYFDMLAKTYPQRVSVQTVGHSFEGRAIKIIRITNGDGRRNKKVIFIDAGIHGREWLGPATALYIAYQLVQNFNNNRVLLQNFEWVILPVVNPDGYEFTHYSNRLWRKSRKQNGRCVGTDINRNFDVYWSTIGSSSSPCDENYHGQAPFSEPETQAVRDVLLSLKGRGVMYLSFHAFGNYILYPWGWSSDLPVDWKDIHEVAKTGAEAIYSATGERYVVGSAANIMYPAAGGSADYAYTKANFPVAITVQLPAGGSGYDPSVQDMKYRLQETWIGVFAMAENVAQKYNY